MWWNKTAVKALHTFNFIQVKFVNSLVSLIKISTLDTNIFEEFKIYNEETKETQYKIEDNIKPEDILKYESRIFMYSKPHLNNINEDKSDN